MKGFLIVFAAVSSALAQYYDPRVGYVASPSVYPVRTLAVGPPVVSPPIIGSPYIRSEFDQYATPVETYPPSFAAPVEVYPPTYATPVSYAPPIASYAPPYTSYAALGAYGSPAYAPIQVMYDENDDEVNPLARRMNSNSQSGVQQYSRSDSASQ